MSQRNAKKQRITQEIMELSESRDGDVLVMTGFDEAVIGIEKDSRRVVYDFSMVIRILVSEGMTEEDAYDHFYYNMTGHIGDNTPIFVDTIGSNT